MSGGDWATPGDAAGEGGSSTGAPPPPPGAQPPPPAPPPGVRPPPPPPPPPGPSGQRVGLIPMYPMGVGDVLDVAFKMLRACAGPATLLVVLLLGPIEIATSAGAPSPASLFSGAVPETFDPRLLYVFAGSLLLTGVVSPLVSAALTWMGAHTTTSGPPDWRDALTHGARRYGATLGAFALLLLAFLVPATVLVAGVIAAALASPVLAALLGVLGGLALLIYSVGLEVVRYLVVPSIVVEQLGPVAGLRRASRLMRARFWPALGVSLLIGLVVTVIGSAVGSTISVPSLFGFPGSWVFAALGGVVGKLLTAPLAAYAALAIHVDLRIRTQGYDVEVLVAELRR